ncbi:hypothetical protein NNJEOMEG_01927 [Fundidesulfovibrio magnetotacticus]|uniref:Uncharacterized protein n=1 Tax=Fundidesulfovibrio magnetotacticus TaxID=2730080 RepID=A0A6V8LUU4_9BACT|nr:hypothetical protein [Fundidesulfovibrio magnetotacticus]GFK94088.1 hypothetical protein NNJEOMEG_01927 [Fundidesulfovibrio magnetotacticus]
MTLQQAVFLRRMAGWSASALLFAALAVLADGLVGGFKDGTRDFQSLPGASLDITAHMPPGAEAIADLRITGETPGVRVVPKELFSGFWLGGAMWRGKIEVDSQAQPGERIFLVEGPPLAEKPQRYVSVPFRVVVHADAPSLRAAAPALLTRLTGFEPYPASLTLFLLALPCGAAGYLLSRRIETGLAQLGKAVVYMIKSEPEGQRIAFSLGQGRGLAPGGSVLLEDAAGNTVGQALVLTATAEDATARVVSGRCTPGDLAVLHGSAPNGA